MIEKINFQTKGTMTQVNIYLFLSHSPSNTRKSIHEGMVRKSTIIDKSSLPYNI